jgi:hypothetical protein
LLGGLTLLSNLPHRFCEQNSAAVAPPQWILKIIPRYWAEYSPDSRSSILVPENKIMMRMGLIVSA